MQIKSAGDRRDDLAALESLLARADLSRSKRAEIEREQRNIRAGAAGEREAAYEIELYFGRSRNFMTIHDLRIEIGEHSAQIDHLILNRVGEIWICESKHFAEGVSVNDRGEWTMYWHGRPQGIPSPIDQNRRHAVLLERAFDDRLVPMPKRLGLIPMRPLLRSLVLVSNNARIGRPRRPLTDIEQVIKVEKLEQTVRGGFDVMPTSRLARLVSAGALEQFARSLAALHRPLAIDWSTRFGLDESKADIVEPISAPPVQPPRAGGGSGHRCADCGEPVSFAVVKFCWNNPDRFDGRVYCMTHQAAHRRA